MEDAIDRRSVLISSFARDLPTRVAVAVESREVAAGNLEPDAVARQKHIGRGPQVELPLLSPFFGPSFGLVLFVTDLLHPVNRLAIEPLLHGDVLSSSMSQC